MCISNTNLLQEIFVEKHDRLRNVEGHLVELQLIVTVFLLLQKIFEFDFHLSDRNSTDLGLDVELTKRLHGDVELGTSTRQRRDL